MDKMAKAVGAFLIFISAVVLLAPLSAAFGALAGIMVNLFFGQTILIVLGKFGLHGVELWQLGATLGFVSPFLRTKIGMDSAK